MFICIDVNHKTYVINHYWKCNFAAILKAIQAKLTWKNFFRNSIAQTKCKSSYFGFLKVKFFYSWKLLKLKPIHKNKFMQLERTTKYSNLSEWLESGSVSSVWQSSSKKVLVLTGLNKHTLVTMLVCFCN